MGYYNQGGGGGMLWGLIFIVAAIFLFVFISKNPAFKTWLQNVMKGLPNLGQQQQQQQQQPPPPSGQQQQQPPPPSGGDSATGANVYQVVAPITTTGNQNQAGCGQAGGDSYRDNVEFPCDKCNRETTWIFVPGTSGGIESCEDVSIKMGSHGGGGDQTALISFAQIPLGGSGGEWASEGPHGDDGGVSGTATGSVTLSTTTQMGIKGISWNVDPAGTQHHEIWVNSDGTGTGWVKAAQFEGTTEGTNPLTCPVPPDGDGKCQDTLRIDGPSGHQFISRSSVEIVPGQLASGGGGGGTTPPTTTPPTTTPPAEEEEEDGDGEEEEEEEPPATTPPVTRPPVSRPPSGGGTPTGSSQGGCPARCAPLRLSAPSSYQACCASGVAGSAKVVMRRALFAKFEFDSLPYTNRRMRVGNLI